jgi:hypothetical protein
MSTPSTTNQDKRQMKTISLTIPMDCNALTRSAEMLTGLAADILEASILSTAPTLPGGQVNKPAETPEGQFVEGLSFADKLARFNETAAEKIAALGTAAKAEIPEGMRFAVKREPFIKYPEELDDSGEYVADKLAGSRDDPDFQEPPHEKTPAEVFGEAETARVLAEMESKSISPDQAAGAVDQHPDEGVELDGDGLPWDHRIHASSKAKLSKAPNCWKRKRGVDPDVIAEVESELRAAMSAGPHNPVKPAPAKPAVPAKPATPAPAAATDSAVATFPELMAAITAGGIAPPAVQAALNLQGITSLPLLASRPDLIPAVAEILGL